MVCWRLAKHLKAVPPCLLCFYPAMLPYLTLCRSQEPDQDNRVDFTAEAACEFLHLGVGQDFLKLLRGDHPNQAALIAEGSDVIRVICTQRNMKFPSGLKKWGGALCQRFVDTLWQAARVQEAC